MHGGLFGSAGFTDQMCPPLDYSAIDEEIAPIFFAPTGVQRVNCLCVGARGPFRMEDMDLRQRPPSTNAHG